MYLQICVAVFAIFLPIYYTLLLNLIDRSEDARHKAIVSKTTTNWMQYYQAINNFVQLSGEYFHLIGIIFLAQVIKIIINELLIELLIDEYLKIGYLIINFLSFWYILSFFPVFKKIFKPTVFEFIMVFIFFYISLPLLWCITYKLNILSIDLNLSFLMLVISLAFWFAIYPVKYKPFSNLRKLKGI